MHVIALSSSRGTTFQAILDAIARGELGMRCLGLVTDRADRGCIEKARAAGVPVKIVEKKPGETREAFDHRVAEAVDALRGSTASSDVVLAAVGWMFVFSPWFIATWKDRILNVHPALLPKYGGKGMYGHHVHDAVLRSRDRETGISIHLMDDGVDTGRILLQKTCPVLPNDTADTLQQRVQELEKEWYPKVLEMIERGEISLLAD